MASELCVATCSIASSRTAQLPHMRCMNVSNVPKECFTLVHMGAVGGTWNVHSLVGTSWHQASKCFTDFNYTIFSLCSVYSGRVTIPHCTHGLRSSYYNTTKITAQEQREAATRRRKSNSHKANQVQAHQKNLKNRSIRFQQRKTLSIRTSRFNQSH